jgi:hypothetical protein
MWSIYSCIWWIVHVSNYWNQQMKFQSNQKDLSEISLSKLINTASTALSKSDYRGDYHHIGNLLIKLSLHLNQLYVRLLIYLNCFNIVCVIHDCTIYTLTPLKLLNRISWNLVGSKDTICSCAYYQAKTNFNYINACTFLYLF